MKPLARSTLFLSLALTSLLGCGGAMADRTESTASPGGDSTIHVPLDVGADSTGPTPKSVPYSPNLRFYLAAVVDQRDEPNIGVNKEGETPTPVVWSGTTPSVFVGDVVQRALRELGVDVTRDAGAANRFLQLRLVRFYVIEGGLYHAEVRAPAELRDRAGQVLFSSLVTGNARQWGRSRNPDNYREVLTRASFDLVKTVMETPGFQTAMQVN